MNISLKSVTAAAAVALSMAALARTVDSPCCLRLDGEWANML